jgi:hypothetical protein
MPLFKLFTILFGLLLLNGCIGNMNPTGGNSNPNYPYFITKKPLVIKKILVPIDTKLVYESEFFKEGLQNQMMSEEKLTRIELLPIGKTIDWGGVPIISISKFFNTEMCGFSVYADFNQLSKNTRTKFSSLWESCSSDLDIKVKNINDWSFNKQNISDIEGCSVIYQRYFKNDVNQQKFLDELYSELMKISSK